MNESLIMSDCLGSKEVFQITLLCLWVMAPRLLALQHEPSEPSSMGPTSTMFGWCFCLTHTELTLLVAVQTKQPKQSNMEPQNNGFGKENCRADRVPTVPAFFDGVYIYIYIISKLYVQKTITCEAWPMQPEETPCALSRPPCFERDSATSNAPPPD